ncbi:hypothetical protein [Gulosibacter molinativorax]|uniref:hypothetical protein n=1 Tax=Gulosibacter molinativorax TaxID=256821 RepID=UPI000429D444|nr:hypothetical protein [Gulosibacter molinativorax]
MAVPRRDPTENTKRTRGILGLTAAIAAVGIILVAIAFPDDEQTATLPTTSTPVPSHPQDVEESWQAAPADSVLAPGFDPYPPTFKLPDATTLTGDAISASLKLEQDATPFGGTVGFSFEGADLASPMWDPDNSNLNEMLAAVENPVIRFGGLKGDRRVWWTSANEPAPSWAEATVTPTDLENVAAVADEVDASVTLVVSLARYDPDRAADMAAHARAIFGDRLLAITIGNEPNGYFLEGEPDRSVRDKTWDTNAYQDGLEEYAAAIESASPGTPISGPGAYDATWWRAFADSSVANQTAMSMHWYPLWDCSGPASSTANPTLEDLTSPKLRESARNIVGMGAETAEQYDLPLWIEETGPTSCSGGNETSRTHAQSLWTTDYVLTAAELGAERIAFHSTLAACEGGAPMSPICATGTYSDPGTIVQGRTSYLALMQLSWIPDGNMLTPTVSGDGTVMVHGVFGADGSLTLVVSDLRDPASGAEALPVTVSAPSGLGADAPGSWSPASGSLLTGESLAAQESSLTALVPVEPRLAALSLSAAEPLTIATQPGSTTMLVLKPNS